MKEAQRFGTSREVPASAMHVEPDASYDDLGERPAVGDSVLRFVEGAERYELCRVTAVHPDQKDPLGVDDPSDVTMKLVDSGYRSGQTRKARFGPESKTFVCAVIRETSSSSRCAMPRTLS